MQWSRSCNFQLGVRFVRLSRLWMVLGFASSLFFLMTSTKSLAGIDGCLEIYVQQQVLHQEDKASYPTSYESEILLLQELAKFKDKDIKELQREILKSASTLTLRRINHFYTENYLKAYAELKPGLDKACQNPFQYREFILTLFTLFKNQVPCQDPKNPMTSKRIVAELFLTPIFSENLIIKEHSRQLALSAIFCDSFADDTYPRVGLDDQMLTKILSDISRAEKEQKIGFSIEGKIVSIPKSKIPKASLLSMMIKQSKLHRLDVPLDEEKGAAILIDSVPFSVFKVIGDSLNLSQKIEPKSIQGTAEERLDLMDGIQTLGLVEQIDPRVAVDVVNKIFQEKLEVLLGNKLRQHHIPTNRIYNGFLSNYVHRRRAPNPAPQLLAYVLSTLNKKDQLSAIEELFGFRLSRWSGSVSQRGLFKLVDLVSSEAGEPTEFNITESQHVDGSYLGNPLHYTSLSLEAVQLMNELKRQAAPHPKPRFRYQMRTYLLDQDAQPVSGRPFRSQSRSQSSLQLNGLEEKTIEPLD